MLEEYVKRILQNSKSYKSHKPLNGSYRCGCKPFEQWNHVASDNLVTHSRSSTKNPPNNRQETFVLAHVLSPLRQLIMLRTDVVN